MTNPDDKATELTKREYFAAMALQGLLARNLATSNTVLEAVTQANHLIAELNRTGGKSA